QPIHVRARAVHFLPYIMPRSMHELISVTRLANHLARGPVHLPPLDRPSRPNVLLHELHGRIPRLSYNVENLGIPWRHPSPQIADPRDVIVDAVGRQSLPPNIE